MAQTPKRSKSKAPNKRTHLPALSQLELEAFQQRLAALPGVSEAGKVVVMQSMRAAANPQAESPRVVIETLDQDRRERIKEAAAGYADIFSAPARRGKAALKAMNDEEWQKAVDDQAAKNDE